MYTTEDFNYLLGTKHRDPDDGFEYIVRAVRKAKGLIVVDRQLLGSTSRKYDTIHALDIEKYYQATQGDDNTVDINKGFGLSRVPTGAASRVGRYTSGHTGRYGDPARGDLISRTGPIPSSMRKRQHIPAAVPETLRRSQRIARAERKIYNFNSNLKYNHIDPSNIIIPKNHRQAKNSPYWDYWKRAEEAEIEGIIKAGCIMEEVVPIGATIIDAKWVYNIKTNNLNQIVRFKARLSARGDQLSFENYGNVFSPVVSWVGIRYFLALTVIMKLKPLQLDFDLAYLNADLEEVIYMRPPPGYEVDKGRAWRLLKSLYGLKQSGKNWNVLLNRLLMDINFTPFEEDPCLYIRINKKNGVITILFIYVDDVYIASNSDRVLASLPERLRKHYPLKILGVPKQLLGVEIKWGENFSTVHLSIRKLIVSLLTQFGMLNTESTSTPMIPGLRFIKDDLPDVKVIKADKEYKEMQKRYRTLVGTFIFICYTCRPDIMFAVNILCRAMANPAYKHYDAAIYMLQFLSGTREAGITYKQCGNLKPLIYADADDGADESRKSCACHIIILAAGPIIWASKFIKEYALSSCESEVRAIAAALPAIKSALYVKKILQETVESGLIDESVVEDIEMKLSMPIIILEDNKAAIDWANKPTSTQRMRHVERSLYWIRQYVQNKWIKLKSVKSEEQLADIGTKPVTKAIFQNLSQRIISYFI